MSSGSILFERSAEGVALVTLNRPEKLNSLNAELIGRLGEAVETIAREPEIRGAILTGAGTRAFAAGADISEFSGWSAQQAQDYSRRGQGVLRRLESMGKPTIAAINGFAFGGGLELAMACSLRVASTTAKLGQPEVKLGLIPGYGGTQRLPRLVGCGRALELLLSGEPVDAAEAYRIGLVNHVVAPEGLLEFCRALLHKLIANAPIAIAFAMKAVDEGLDTSLDTGLQHEAALFGLAAATEDMREGVSAFLEKRKPTFHGR